MNVFGAILIIGRGYMHVNKEYTAGTVPSNKKYAAGTVPENKKYAAGTVPVRSMSQVSFIHI